ncbi:uncharacterized protein LOC110828880 [Zootermopsis nevadensis]|uniref:uncharacterized protein LOC110828880 n=1 Tax=Zootermopsis nevadensis TaxID=136037 RepID=UPI000B8EB090|nr:uncharacterized protein LOC110828880 [Zootermopsis nevadensis]
MHKICGTEVRHVQVQCQCHAWKLRWKSFVSSVHCSECQVIESTIPSRRLIVLRTRKGCMESNQVKNLHVWGICHDTTSHSPKYAPSDYQTPKKCAAYFKIYNIMKRGLLSLLLHMELTRTVTNRNKPPPETTKVLPFRHVVPTLWNILSAEFHKSAVQNQP